MKALAAVRTLLARWPLLYWAMVASVAGVAASTVADRVRSVDDARRSWGDVTDAWVAAADIEPGSPLAVEQRSLPVAVVPADALREPPDGVAVQHLVAGEIVTRDDVATGPLALLPTGTVGVAVRRDETSLRVAIGDHVAVVVGAAIEVDDAAVVDVGERSVTIAVPVAAAGSVAAAAHADDVALALRLPSRPGG